MSVEGGIGPRAEVEAALLAAMTVVIGLVAVTVPPAYMLVVALPVPTAVSAYRHRGQTAALGGLVAVLLGAMVPSVVFAVSTIAPMVVTGWAIGVSFRRPLPVWVGCLATWAAAVVALLLAFLAGAILFYGGPAGLGREVADSLNAFQRLVNGSVAMLQALGVPSSQLPAWRALLRTLEPVLLIFTLLLPPTLSYVLTWILFGRLGFRRPAVEPLRLWNLPPAFFVLYLSALIFDLLGPLLHTPFLNTVGTNLLLPASLAMMIQGLAVVQFLLHRRNWSARARWMVGILVLMLLPSILTIVGMFDFLMDLRRITPQGPGNTRGDRA